MAHDTHAGGTGRIWSVFWILSIITIVEVVLGIFKPGALVHTSFIGMTLLNWIFIILTIVKAYYIMWAFMHLEHEKASVRWAVVGTLVFLILYLTFILLEEGSYIHHVYNNSTMKWNF